MTEDSWERARRVLAAAGLSPDRLARCRPLDGGTYNTVEELLLTDGTRHVLKVPPPETAPGLRHERELLVSEAEFYRSAATVDVPAPRVVAMGGRHLLMTACPGQSWNGTLTPDEQNALRAELGGLVARLHQVTGPGFGYPSGALGPLAPDWRTAFTTMYDAVLDDARRYRAWLPRPVEEVARTAKAAYDSLDEVTTPAWSTSTCGGATSSWTARTVHPGSAASSTASACSGATLWGTSSPSPFSVTSSRTPPF